MKVAVVVLGELSRSPRMLNHARALSTHGHQVTLIGYSERPLDIGNVRVNALHPIDRAPEGSSRVAFLMKSAVRMGLLFLELIGKLVSDRPDAVLIQNPPNFPTLLAMRIATSRLITFRRIRRIIDWHNYGYTLLQLRLGKAHWLPRVAERHERWSARLAHAHLCVSRAMKRDLHDRFHVNARTLYDRPLTIRPTHHPAGSDTLTVVCPAGWTADENTEMLIDALALVPVHSRMLRIVVTGDGPQRELLAPRLHALARPDLAIRTGFLPEPEYRDAIASAELGLSFHTSSSGLDLAMKVVDLFACGVPVAAFDYGDCLREQITDGVTGCFFRNSSELAAILNGLREDPRRLGRMREAINASWSETWDDAWQKAAAPLFD